MKKYLLFIILIIFNLSLLGQKDNSDLAVYSPQKENLKDVTSINISIFPVPVTDNSFTIKTDRDISAIKITNIIGQDIYRIQYNNPLQLTRILLENPKRGMYLVTILFSDGNRIIKKILVEEYK